MSKIEITTELHQQIRAFLRTFEDDCRNCMKRNLGYCDDCRATVAKRIAQRMDAGLPIYRDVDTTLMTRMAKLYAVLKKTGRPMRSIDIDISDYCSRSLKEWTLQKMISLGKIQRVKEGFFYLYSIPDRTQRKTKTTTKKEHQNGCNQEKCAHSRGTSRGNVADQ